ncbi:MAG: hypothetical protein P1U40_05750 [Coxiellaceae bacterium]|nr:hypothetical protein [Coxiellaceae bacterium]
MRRGKKLAAEQEAAALKTQSEIAIAQSAQAWRQFQQLATSSGHHFGDYHDTVIEIAKLSERFSVAFQQGVIKTEHAIKAKVILGATRELATRIYAIEKMHEVQWEYFVENANLWIQGLESVQFSGFLTTEKTLDELDDVKFGTDPIHPPVTNHAGFAYGMLRGFLSHLLSSGNFLAVHEVANKYTWNKFRKLLLAGISRPDNKIRANNAMQACLAACQVYCQSLAPAETKAADVTPVPSPAPPPPLLAAPTVVTPALEAPPNLAPSDSPAPLSADDDIDSPRPAASTHTPSTIRDEFTDDESDGDTNSDVDEFKTGFIALQVTSAATPPPTPPATPIAETPVRASTPDDDKAATAPPVAMTALPSSTLFATVLPTNAKPKLLGLPGLPGMRFFTSSSWVPNAAPPSTETTRTNHATRLLANIEHYLRQRSHTKPGWMSNAPADFDARQQCYDDVCAYIKDIVIVEDQETMEMLSTSLIKFIREKTKPFTTNVPIFGTQNFHDHLESLCVALEDGDNISIENLQEVIKRMHPAIEARATETSPTPSPAV